jgi:hypothetical protein
LRAQTRAADIELVLAAFEPDAVEPYTRAWSEFHSVCLVPCGKVRPGVARTQAVARARAPVIAFAEDHCFPSPNWAEVLLDAHQADVAAVAVEMRNPNPSSVARAHMHLSFSRWIAPAVRGEMTVLPGHNTSYKRAILEGYGAALTAMLDSEVVMHGDLTWRGEKLFMETRAYVSHLNVSRWKPLCAHKLWGGRIYGASRAAQNKWGLSRRVLYALGAPLVPFVRFKRMLPDLRRTGALRSFDAKFLFALALGLAFHALGEAAGYVGGIGNAREKYAPVELDRAAQLRADERHLAFDERRASCLFPVRDLKFLARGAIRLTLTRNRV